MADLNVRPKMKAFARILLQVIVAGPVIIYTPLAVVMGIGAIVFLFKGEQQGISKTLGYGLGWLGLIGLYGSIFTPLGTVRAHRWLRQAIIGCIVCGFIATAAILCEDSDPIGFLARGGLFTVYLLIGPVIVGAWNLARIWSKEPNSEGRVTR